MSRNLLAALCSALLLLATPLHSQVPAPASQRNGLILGQVVDAGTGRPVRGAVVTLTSPALPQATGPAGAPGTPPTRVSTTADGAFVFRALPRGDYTITAGKPGYVAGSFGRRQPDGVAATLALGDGEKIGDVTIPIWRVGAIGGIVVDERGEPIVGVELQAFQRVNTGGRRRFRRAGLPATTDDRGIYRFGMLSPGDYVVGVSSVQVAVPLSALEAYREALQSRPRESGRFFAPLFEVGANTSLPGNARNMQVGTSVRTLNAATPPPQTDGRVFVYPSTFHPSALLAAQAAVVPIGSGEERTDIDIQLRPVLTRPVSGVLTGPEDAVGGVALRLVPEGPESGAEIETAAATLSAVDGTFTFPAVPLGSYALKALKRVSEVAAQLSRNAPTLIQVGSGFSVATSVTTSDAPTGPPPPAYWAAEPLTVGRTAPATLSIAMRPGLRVSGRVVFEGSQPSSAGALAQTTIALEPASGIVTNTLSPVQARADRAGQFELPGAAAGRYVLRVSGTPPGWTLRSALASGRDLSDLPFDLETDVPAVSVALTDSPGEIAGIVRSRQGPPDTDASVIVFPTDMQMWAAGTRSPRRFRLVRTGRDGSYKFVSLPPGEYYLAAMPDDAAAGWQDGAFLEMLGREGTRVTVSGSERQTRNLSTRDVR